MNNSPLLQSSKKPDTEISSLQHAQSIQKITAKHLESCDIDYVAVGIILKSGKHIVSNYPAEIVSAYYAQNLQTMDATFDINHYPADACVFFPNELADNFVNNMYRSIIEEQFSCFNCFGLIRRFEDVDIIVITSSQLDIQDKQACYQQNKIRVETATLAIINEYLTIFAQALPALRFSRFFKDARIREEVIHGKRKHLHADYDFNQLKPQYLETLKALSHGKTYAEVAIILGVKDVTIQNRINTIKEITGMIDSNSLQLVATAIRQGAI